MHNAIVKLFKYILRAIFWLILALLLVWLAKSDWDLSAYISLLNQQTISNFKWFSIFQTKTSNTWDMILFTWNSNESWFKTWEDSQIDSWLDVYDPQFEQDMQDASLDSILSGEEQDYWFKKDTSTDTTITSTWTMSAQQKLMELLKQNEMKK